MSEMHDDCEIKWHKLGNSQWRLLGATRRSIATEMQCPRCVRFSTEQRTSGDVSNVPNTRRSRLYAKDRLIIAVEVRELKRSCTLPSSALNAFIDERIEPLSPDKLRGIVPLNARAGAA
jgi:hypothetical protein